MPPLPTYKIRQEKAILNLVIIMKVKVFDEDHEKDLELAINEFLCENDIDVLDIKYEVAVCVSGGDVLDLGTLLIEGKLLQCSLLCVI